MERMRNYAMSVAESLSRSDAVATTSPSRIAWQLPDVEPLFEEAISSERIEEIMPTMLQGVHELRQPILSGTYHALIGDDTSGRIPTLILRGVMNQAALLNGHDYVPAYFIKGQHGDLAQSVTEGLRNRLQRVPTSNLPHRALLVTEFMSKGSHVKCIGDSLQQIGIPYDIFSVGRAFSEEYYYEKDIVQQDTRIFPQILDPLIGDNLHRAPHLSGYEYSGGRVRPIPQYRKSFLSARNDVRIAVNRLVKEELLRK